MRILLYQIFLFVLLVPNIQLTAGSLTELEKFVSYTARAIVQNILQKDFDQILVKRFAIGLVVDTLVRNYLPSDSSTTKNITSFLIQAGTGYILYDHTLAPQILELYDEHNNISWTRATTLGALRYVFKISTVYLSAQKINDGIHHLINKLRASQKNEQKLYQEIDATNDNELQRQASQ